MNNKFFDLKVGFSCNNDCIHCVVTDKRKTEDLSTEEIKDLIDGLDAEYIIGFTGGEPTIRKDFIEILKYAKEKGHSTALQTNGTMFESEEFTDEVIKYLDSVLIAIHSHIPEIHNRIVSDKTNKMYYKTIQGFKNLAKNRNKLFIRTQTVISKLNIKDLPETYDFIQDIMPNVPMNLTFPHPNGGAWINRDLVVPRYSEIRCYLQEILSRWAHLIQTEAIPMCYLYPYQNKVEWNIDERLMTDFLNTEGIDPSQKNNEARLFDENGITKDYQTCMMSEKIKGPKCSECIFNNRCPGVWIEYMQMYSKKLDLFPIKDIEIKESNYEKNIIKADSDYSSKYQQLRESISLLKNDKTKEKPLEQQISDYLNLEVLPKILDMVKRGNNV
jgi:MoaA/NifB/PqqE/SkfB family radical SAM enzyme